MHEINTHPDLALNLPRTPEEQFEVSRGFKAKSAFSTFSGCVGVIDGWLCRIRRPGMREAGLAGTKRFFSGHYQTFGMNVQAVCDSYMRFTFISMKAPGSSSDLVAFETSSLFAYMTSLAIGLYLIGDNAYR